MAGQYEEQDHTMTPWPAHGGRLSDLERLFADAPRPWIDLSTGINPHAYPFTPPGDALMARLPDPVEEKALREAAAEAYGVDPSLVLAGPGTQMLIGLLPGFLMRHGAVPVVRVVSPTYSGHEAAWKEAGARVVHVPWGAALAPPERRAVTVLCSPNNPTGHALTRGDMVSQLEAHAQAGAVLIVDEAYADFLPETASALLPHPSLIVCRSFGKTYGLAGLRVGFLLGSHPVIQALRAAMGPWAISTAGCHIAAEALRDRAWRRRMAERLAIETGDMRQVVAQAGLHLVGGTELFSLFRSPDAAAIWERMARAGLLARRFEWDATLIRIGLPPDEAAMRRLREVFGAYGGSAAGCASPG